MLVVLRQTLPHRGAQYGVEPKSKGGGENRGSVAWQPLVWCKLSMTSSNLPVHLYVVTKQLHPLEGAAVWGNGEATGKRFVATSEQNPILSGILLFVSAFMLH